MRHVYRDISFEDCEAKEGKIIFYHLSGIQKGSWI